MTTIHGYAAQRLSDGIWAQLRSQPDGSAIELSNGPDDPPRQVHMQLPPWPGRLAHTRHADEAIYLFERPVYEPGDPVDFTCGHCAPRSEIAHDHETEAIVFIVHHQAGCPAVDDLLQMAGL